ncbi:MAG: hypothetical protein JWM71_1326 [Solirubrobacteraceae bacterium]|nr:hypothetical protein [Solirubrobacteraceae bacterium]
MAPEPQPTPASRDRTLRSLRAVAWLAGVVTAALTAVFSVVAAHAFKGHTGKTHVIAAVRRTRPPAHNTVPPAQHVPAIASAPAQLQPPQQAPAPAQSAPAQSAPAQSAPVQPAPVQPAPVQQAPPQTSGGS